MSEKSRRNDISEPVGCPDTNKLQEYSKTDTRTGTEEYAFSRSPFLYQSLKNHAFRYTVLLSMVLPELS